MNPIFSAEKDDDAIVLFKGFLRECFPRWGRNKSCRRSGPTDCKYIIVRGKTLPESRLSVRRVSLLNKVQDALGPARPGVVFDVRPGSPAEAIPLIWMVQKGAEAPNGGVGSVGRDEGGVLIVAQQFLEVGRGGGKDRAPGGHVQVSFHGENGVADLLEGLRGGGG